MEICGGARGDFDARSLVAGVSTFKSKTRAAIFCVKADASGGCGCAERDVVTPRQQSWLQQLALLTVGWSVSPNEP
jgi:hypothetical protein